MAEPPAEPSRWSDVFWLGLAFVVLGVFTPETLVLGDTRLSMVLFWSGAGLLLARVLVSVYRFLGSAVASG
ncbi:hypothetical protein [Haloglomus litoreum]|uniref:hypothetical protein n=1 Tax=Haloglomus litoreum TaxID=3034026 RepID=UPI0023E80D42|nr:hypothetical protein [Haloglomus sp. DT116]